MDRITAMQAYVRVVQTRNFTRVAEEFHTQQPTISKWMAGLEKHLGVQLLNRNTRKIAVTEAGEVYFKRCEHILNELNSAELELRQGIAKPKGHLRLSLPSVFGRTYIVPLIKSFNALYPDITIDLLLSDRRVDLIAEGIDLALRTGDLQSSSLIARRLTRYRRVLVASPEYIQLHGVITNPDQLEKHRCLVHSLLFEKESWHFVRGKTAKTVSVSGSIKVNSGDALVQLAVDGLGVALLPDWMVKNELNNGSLKEMMKGYKTQEKNIYMVYPQRQYLPMSVVSFIEHLSLHF